MEPARLVEIRTMAHANCAVCSPKNKRGLGVEFTLSEGGCVEATFDCDKVFEGYSDLLHGGVIASLLDGAMTNCMFAHGCIAVTAELNIRFRNPVVIGAPVIVRAWIDKDFSPLYVVRAEVIQNHKLKATAVGKFMKRCT